MNCEEIEKLMMEADAQATVDTVVRKHLVMCASCRAAWRDYEEVMAGLREMEAMQPSAGFTERIVARMQLQRSLKRTIGLAAAVCVAVGLGAWVFAATIQSWTITATASANNWAVAWVPSWESLVTSLTEWGNIEITRAQLFGLPLWQIGALAAALAIGWLVTEAMEYIPRRNRRD